MDSAPPVPDEGEERLRRALEALEPEVHWRGAEPDDFFDLVLTGDRGVDRLRLCVRAYHDAGPEDVQAMLDFAAGQLDATAAGLTRETFAFLLIASQLRQRDLVEGHLKAFHARNWLAPTGRRPRALVALAAVADPHPTTPGAARPWPDLPRLDLPEALGEGVAAPGAEAPRPQPPPRHEPLDVLVVDDDPVVRAMVGDLLRERGLRVEVAAAWDQVRQRTFGGPVAVILLDVCMPGISGDRVAKLVRFSRPPRPRVLLYSGLPECELATLATDVGAEGYLHKGCSEAELLGAIEALLAG